MEIKHRMNSEERQHYLLEHRYSFKVKPQLLYVGKLNNTSAWAETEHHHDFLEILLVKSGRGTVNINGQVRSIKKGDIIIYNAGTPHAESGNADKPLNLYFIALNKLSITDLPENYLLPPGYSNYYTSGKLYDLFCTMFEVMIYEFDRKEQFYAEIAQNISRTMLMYIFRIINSVMSEKEKLHSNKIVSRAIEYINEHYRDNITLDELAEYCYVSRYYLSRLFSGQKHMTIKEFIIKKRMDEAKSLLRYTDMPAVDVAQSVGIYDGVYFSKLFKRETGTTTISPTLQTQVSRRAWR